MGKSEDINLSNREEVTEVSGQQTSDAADKAASASGTPDGMMTLRLIPELCRMRFAYPAYTRCQVR